MDQAGSQEEGRGRMKLRPEREWVSPWTLLFFEPDCLVLQKVLARIPKSLSTLSEASLTNAVVARCRGKTPAPHDRSPSTAISQLNAAGTAAFFSHAWELMRGG